MVGVAAIVLVKLGGLLAAGWALTRKAPPDPGESPADHLRQWAGDLLGGTLDLGLADVAAGHESPHADTLEMARVQTPTLTLDEYTLARIVASEFASGSPAELCCLADADWNRAHAAGHSIWWTATQGSGFGAQGESSGDGAARPVSTARPPAPRHILAALAVTRGKVRGISKGARRYFDPETQDALSRRDPTRWCPAATILERWSYAKPWLHTDAQGRRVGCELGKAGPGPGEEWVGDIDGVRPTKLMLLRPGTGERDALFQRARDILWGRAVG